MPPIAPISPAEDVVQSLGGDLDELTDEELLDLSRQGNRAAYSMMWTRHSDSGLNSARFYGRELDPHDLVAEAYSKIYFALSRGGGPKTAFRTYLQVTIRNIANKWRNEQRSFVDLEAAEQAAMLDSTEDDPDSREDRSLMQAAFSSLPESWQEVLWYTEVLDLKPQTIASKLNMSPNSVSVLSFRARDGLRKAWIRAHLGDEKLPKACADTIDRLPAHILGNQTPQRSRKIVAHLETCESCGRIRYEAEHTASRLHTVVLPLMLTGGIGAGILGTLGGAPTSASAASMAWAGSAKVSALGGTKVALIAGAAAVTIGTVVVLAVLNGNASQQLVTSSSGSSESVISEDNPPETLPDDANTAAESGGKTDTTEDSEVVGRDDWSGRPDQAEEAALFSVPVVAEVEAPQYAFSANTVFATSAPLLSGYATPSATVTLFIAVDGATAGSGYEKLTAQATAAGSWAVNSESIPDGEYTVRAHQQLGEGPRSDTATRSFKVNNGLQLPTPTIDTVDDANSRLLPIVTGTGTPGAIVNVLINGVANESAIASDGTWSVTTVRGGVVGTNELVVRQRERSSQNVSAETAPRQFELKAPEITLDTGGPDPVLVVTAIPQSSVTVTDGKGFTHRLTDTLATNRIRLIDNAAAGAAAATKQVSVVYTGDNGRRVGAPVVRQLQL